MGTGARNGRGTCHQLFQVDFDTDCLAQVRATLARSTAAMKSCAGSRQPAGLSFKAGPGGHTCVPAVTPCHLLPCAQPHAGLTSGTHGERTKKTSEGRSTEPIGRRGSGEHPVVQGKPQQTTEKESGDTHHQHVLQQLQVPIGTLPAKAQRPLPHVGAHLGVVGGLLEPRDRNSYQDTSPAIQGLKQATCLSPSPVPAPQPLPIPVAPCRHAACPRWRGGSGWLWR